MSFWKRLFGLGKKEQEEINEPQSQTEKNASHFDSISSSSEIAASDMKSVTDQERQQIADIVSKMDIPKANIMGVELDMKELLVDALVQNLEDKLNGVVHKDIEIKDRWLTIDSIDFSGLGDPSPNGRYFAAHSYDNRVVVVDLVNEAITINSRKNSLGPVHPMVNDTGWLLLVHDKGDRKDEMQLFTPEGKLVLKKTINANIYNTGISSCGRYICCQACNNPSHNDGGKLFIVETNTKKSYSWIPETGWAKAYTFEDGIITLHYDDGRSYRYHFSGELVDKEVWNKERLKVASGYVLEEMGYEKLAEIEGSSPSSLKDYSEVLELFNAACNKLISNNHKANMYRSIGEIYLKFDMKGEAITEFKKAIEHNPKIGLKRIVASLEKELNS